MPSLSSDFGIQTCRITWHADRRSTKPFGIAVSHFANATESI